MVRGQHDADRADEIAVIEQARRQVDRHIDVESALAQLRRRADRLIHHEQGEAIDVLALFGLDDELVGRDGATRRVRPARERFDPDELFRRDFILRLEGDPDVAAGERILELRVKAQLPAGVFLLARSIFRPQRPGADRAFGGDERRGEPLGVRPFEFVVDAEGDRDVDAQLADRQRRVEQRGEARELPLDLAVLVIRHEPGEGAVEIVVERRALRGELEAAGDLFDELADAVAGDEGGEILEIHDLGGDDGRAAERRQRTQRFEVRQARNRVLALCRIAAACSRHIGTDGCKEEQPCPDRDRDKLRREQQLRGDEEGGDRRSEDAEPPVAAP